MNKNAFWQLVDASREQAGGGLDEQVENLRSRIEQLEPDEIIQFGELFAEYWSTAYTWDLWAAAYIIGGGCSDDGFLDFRAWLISKGEKVFEEALIDPESLVEVVSDDASEDCQYEGFQYVARQAWENKTRNGMGDFPVQELTHAPEPAGVRWSEQGDDLERRFPRLWRKFAAPPPLRRAASGSSRLHRAKPRRRFARRGSAAYSPWWQGPTVLNSATRVGALCRATQQAPAQATACRPSKRCWRWSDTTRRLPSGGGSMPHACFSPEKCSSSQPPCASY